MKQSVKQLPAPGSEAARGLGCTCPVSDNHNGKGMVIDGRVVYWYRCDCPVHQDEGAS